MPPYFLPLSPAVSIGNTNRPHEAMRTTTHACNAMRRYGAWSPYFALVNNQKQGRSRNRDTRCSHKCARILSYSSQPNPPLPRPEYAGVLFPPLRPLLPRQQHDNENFYLDVVELRTSAPPVPDGGADDDDYSSECCDDGGHEGRQDGDSFDNNHDLAGGKQVRLVSLLGDLDLEVEFCPPPTRPQKAGEHLTELRDGEEEHSTKSASAATASGHPASSSVVPAITSTHDRAAGEERSRQTDSAAYLPVPATAKICDSVVVAAEPSRKAGE